MGVEAAEEALVAHLLWVDQEVQVQALAEVDLALVDLAPVPEVLLQWEDQVVLGQVLEVLVLVPVARPGHSVEKEVSWTSSVEAAEEVPVVHLPWVDQEVQALVLEVLALALEDQVLASGSRLQDIRLTESILTDLLC